MYLFFRERKLLKDVFLLIALFTSFTMFAQTKSIQGIVRDSQQQPLPGVSIVVKESQNGVITDANGHFTIKGVKPEESLIFSYLGFQKLTVKVGKQPMLDIILREDVATLDEVVVVGYGVQKKSDLTGSVASMRENDIARQATVSAAEALRGQIAGVNVVNTGGKPGSEMMIEIRGTNTIGQDSPPLIIIDGVEGDISMFSALNPNSIEKMDVLKDASATAVYGSRGSNGVIIITTRSGKKGRNRISYDGSFGVKIVRDKPDMMTAQEFLRMHDVMDLYWGNVNRQHRIDNQERNNVLNGTTTDWIDFLISNGMQTSHNVSVSGGNDKSTHYLSLGYTKEEGNLEPEGFERLSANLKMSAKVGKYINVGGSINVNYTNTNLAGGEALRSIYRTRPTTRCFDDNAEPIFWLNTWEQQIPNPYFEKENSTRQNRKVQAWGKIYVDIKPWKFLTFQTSINPSFSYLRSGIFEDVYTKANAGRNPAYSSLRKQTSYAYTWDNTLTFNKTYGNHKITATGLFSMQSSESDWNNMEAEGMLWNTLWNNMGAADKVRGIDSSLTKSNLMSAMMRINYIYNNRYLLTVTGRADGSSRLSTDNQWGIFPSAALGWIISEEAFMKQFTNLSNLKLRASYGISGNDRAKSYSSYMLLSRADYDFAGEPGVGFIPMTLANKNLRWEKSEEFNLGLDIGLFSNRVSFSADIYTKDTKDLILTRKLPTHIGYDQVSDNVGALNNKGIELALTTVNITTKDFQWTTNINFAMNLNKIKRLYGDNADDIGNGLFIGHPVKTNYAYVYDGIWQIGEALRDNFNGTPTFTTTNKYGQLPGQPKVKDFNNDGVISSEYDKQIIGNMDPKWTGGMTNTFNYKGFDLSVFVYARIGEQKLSTFHETFASDYSGRFNVLNYDYWTPENQGAKHWAPGSQANSEIRKAANYKDCSFVKVGNITLGYEFNPKMLRSLKLERLRVYLTALNPFVFTEYDGWDPEWAERSVNSSALANTTIMGGINLSF